MKCYGCDKDFPLSRWRTINLKDNKTMVGRKRTLASKPLNYYMPPNTQQYANIYACPFCGTLKVRSPIDKS